MSFLSFLQWIRKRVRILYVTFLMILCIAILLMPIASAQKEATRVLMFISGSCFWIGLIGTVLMAVEIFKARKAGNLAKDQRSAIKKFEWKSIFLNKETRIADIAMIVSMICFVIIRICTDNLYWPFVFLTIFVFSLGMHGLLKGQKYIDLDYKVGREKKS